MNKVNISAKYDPETAIFWAMSATEVGQREKHCPTVTLYENPDGEFFVTEQSPGVKPTRAELIDDPGKWLDDRVAWLNAQMPSPTA